MNFKDNETFNTSLKTNNDRLTFTLDINLQYKLDYGRLYLMYTIPAFPEPQLYYGKFLNYASYLYS